MYAILVSYGEMDYPIQRERQVRNISTSTQSPYLIFRRYINGDLSSGFWSCYQFWDYCLLDIHEFHDRITTDYTSDQNHSSNDVLMSPFDSSNAD